jgi:predicted membrane-bound mannosyltransferase
MNLPEPPITGDLPGGERTYDNLEFLGGKALVFQNDTNAILFRTRITAMVFTVVLALLVFAAARDMFGVGAGLIALALIAFDPTLMGHSALATLDAGNACLMFWAIYAFYRYVKSPTAWRPIATGVIVGLALAAKHSAILLFPTMGALAIIEVAWRGKAGRGRYEPSTRKLSVTEKTFRTPLARRLHRFLSIALATTPSRVTWPFSTMM